MSNLPLRLGVHGVSKLALREGASVTLAAYGGVVDCSAIPEISPEVGKKM